VSREATQERIATSDEPPIEESVSSRSTRPWTVRYAAASAVELALLLPVAAELLPGGEELLLRADSGWKEGLGHRTRAS
jgi:hypothetical protein